LDREWETYDGKNFGDDLFLQGCTDIASQLVDDNLFKINVGTYFEKASRNILKNALFLVSLRWWP